MFVGHAVQICVVPALDKGICFAANVPGRHAVQEPEFEAPFEDVDNPLAHCVQAVTDEFEYEPCAQGVHVAPPGKERVLITLPAGHNPQGCVEEEVYLPAMQGVHDMAPAEASVLVTLPAAQTTHDPLEA